MKQNFENIVREHTGWIYRYIRGKVSDREIAEDLTQEVWLRAYRAYDSYTEDGRLRHWLMRIAQNTVMEYCRKPMTLNFVSLDAEGNETDALLGRLADPESGNPEEKLIQRELIADVLAAIERLPEKHRMVMTYRYIWDLSVSETARRMNIPEGSVKSAAHYAIGKIKKDLNIENGGIRKGKNSMECREAYKYLFIYALGKLNDGKRAEVEKHLRECETCRDIAEALGKLMEHLPKENPGSMTHYCISFPEVGCSYTGVCVEIPDADRLNAILAEWQGQIPEGENWMCSGHGRGIEKIAEFLNEGEEIRFRSEFPEDDPEHIFCRVTYLPKLYRRNWQYSAYLNTGRKEVCGKEVNCLGNNAYSALYQAVPKQHGKLVMKRGNGFIDCGSYTFAYTGRYIADEETLRLQYTFE
ncbi:MAG: sigma-70 family RNA polymerase sigma factor [Clostridia bacterium]|nr:sigma-70 family RNA polymerase sigma factor [Clostridia bacterium]